MATDKCIFYVVSVALQRQQNENASLLSRIGTHCDTLSITDQQYGIMSETAGILRSYVFAGSFQSPVYLPLKSCKTGFRNIALNKMTLVRQRLKSRIYIKNVLY
jgi:hypothetical protein